MHLLNSLGRLILLVGTDIFFLYRFPKQIFVPIKTKLVHRIDLI